MDLSIEGQRLIAREIAFEAGMAWRALGAWWRGRTDAPARRGMTPSA